MSSLDTATSFVRYTAKDLLGLTPGRRITIYVSQENIDDAIPGDKRNCAFVRALHSAIESCYRAEVAGNHIYVWIDFGDEKWELEFYMSEEAWDLANMFDINRSDVHPTVISIHFRSGKQKNRQRKSSRRVEKFRPGPPKATLVSQILSKAENDIKEAPKAENNNKEVVETKPIVKPISVPGQKAAQNGLPKSRWAVEGYYRKTA
jgi:hypothetical protein